MSELDAVRGRGPLVLLESRSTGPLGRRHLLARFPRAVVVGARDEAWIATPAGVRHVEADPLGALQVLRLSHPAATIVGAIGYEAARPARPVGSPLLVALAVDRLEPWPAPRREDADDGAVLADAAWQAWADRHGGGAPPPAAETVPADRFALGTCASMSREEHGRLVRAVKDHIARGDVYQANLAQRFRVRCPAGGLVLYEHLRRVSPTPFAGYLRVGGVEIASASPERLLLVDGDAAETRPIAGTRPRSTDPEQDAALRAQLLLSEKERAEHLMLVDLARNDLGRVAAVGTVHVDELMVVEEYAQVRHIVSNVRARLRPGAGALDALAAVFPGGTITGVPKRRCMEILDRLEPVPRGFYTGALFYWTGTGRLDANILIRSAVVQDGTATFHAGGGIVADSDPDHEYEETLHKAEAVRRALAEAVSS